MANDQEKLALRVGETIARMFLESLPRLSEAMQNENASASFTATIQTSYNKGGELIAVVKPRERIPLAPEEIKLTVDDDGQLGLFEGAANRQLEADDAPDEDGREEAGDE